MAEEQQPQIQPQQAPAQPAQFEGGGSWPTPPPSPESGDHGSSPQADPAAPEPQAPSQDEDDGQLSAEELQELVEFKKWAQANPEFVNAMAAVAEGRAVVQPVEATGEQLMQPQQAQPQPQQAQQEEDDSWKQVLPPQVVEKLEAIEGLEQTVYDQQYERNLAAITRGADAFANQYGLSPEELAALEHEVNQSGLLPTMAAAASDPAQGMQDALEVAYFRNPEMRQRELQRQAEATLEAERRKAKAASVSGPAASASRETPQAPTNDRNEITSRIAAEIRQAQAGQNV